MTWLAVSRPLNPFAHRGSTTIVHTASDSRAFLGQPSRSRHGVWMWPMKYSEASNRSGRSMAVSPSRRPCDSPPFAPDESLLFVASAMAANSHGMTEAAKGTLDMPRLHRRPTEVGTHPIAHCQNPLNRIKISLCLLSHMIDHSRSRR